MNLEKILAEDLMEKDFSIYGTSEFITMLIDEYDINVHRTAEDIELILSNECALLTRLKRGLNRDIWVLEELFNDGDQIYNEIDVALIEADIMDEIDLDKIISDEIVILCNDEEELDEISTDDELDDFLEDELDDFLEDVVDEFLEELEDTDCAVCLLKEYFRDIYEIGRKDALVDAIDRIGEVL